MGEKHARRPRQADIVVEEEVELKLPHSPGSRFERAVPELDPPRAPGPGREPLDCLLGRCDERAERGPVQARNHEVKVHVRDLLERLAEDGPEQRNVIAPETATRGQQRLQWQFFNDFSNH